MKNNKKYIYSIYANYYYKTQYLTFVRSEPTKVIDIGVFFIIRRSMVSITRAPS